LRQQLFSALRSLASSLWFGAGVVAVALFAMGIVAFPAPVEVRAVLLAVWLLFVGAVVWHRQSTNWESRARRRAANALSILGAALITKAMVSQVLQVTGISGNLHIGLQESSQISARLLLAFANSPWPVDVALGLLGVLSLVAVLALLRTGVSTRVPVAFADDQPRSFRARYSAFDTYDSDLPPHIDTWVGRASELNLLKEVKQGVVAITGIGGQGKSALAATLLKELRATNPNLFWDWRDCREQADSFRLQLVSVLEHITNGEVHAADVADADIKWLTRFFFRRTKDKAGLIVFDNVDHYVDVYNHFFTSSVSTFVEEAQRIQHGLLIVFTCRPRVSYASLNFREIYLRGLELEEAKELFRKRMPLASYERIAETIGTIYELTAGHPLWLNIISAQLARKPEVARTLISTLKDGSTDDPSNAMLRGIWSTLDENQKTILSCMAELPRALKVELIFEYVGSAVTNHNRFDRAFRALRATSLITEKTSGDTEASRFELHPIVRAFVRAEHRNATQRNEQLDRLIACCEQIVIRLKTDQPHLVSIAFLENVTTKAELEYARGRTAECIETLVNSFDALISRGIADEFIRISKQVLDGIDWTTSSVLDDDDLDGLVERLADIMAERGLEDELRPYLDRFETSVRPGTARYIGFCSIKTYVAWITKDFEEAIKWGERGEKIKKQSGLDTQHDTSYHLALARRDSGQVKLALSHFIGGQSLDGVLSVDHVARGKEAPFYGNVGRCMALLGDWAVALRLYCRSYDLLEKSHTSPLKQINSGYAALWIGQALFNLERPDEAFRFLRRAETIWSRRAPKLLEQNQQELETIKPKVSQAVLNEPPSGIDGWCNSWVASFLAEEKTEGARRPATQSKKR
jgi:tetratricopeptide (TPR) repeat protein